MGDACAALFGMNLVSGWEAVDGLFWKVGSCSLGLGLVIYFGLRATHALRLGGHSSMSSYKLERDALHELLTYNLDDIGDIVLALAEAQERCVVQSAAVIGISLELLHLDAENIYLNIQNFSICK